VEFRILGPLRVIDGEWTITIDGDKPRRLLVELLRRPGETIAADELVAAVWGDEAPATAHAALRVYVAQLRRSLGADAIKRRATGYALIAARDQVDRARFEDLLAAARADPRTAAQNLAAALALLHDATAALRTASVNKG
jgi:DNA-binding SARP family transcriptional activator